MKPFIMAFLSAALLASTAAPVHAQALIGGKEDNAVVTVGSGDAGSSGVVNLGLGGENQVLDAKIGNGRIGSANVGAGGSSDLDAEIDLLNDEVEVDLAIGEDDGLVDLDVGVGGPGDGGAGQGFGDDALMQGGNLANAAAPVCSTGTSTGTLEQLILGTEISAAWQSASDVAIEEVSVCPQQRAWLTSTLAESGLGPHLRAAVQSDALLSASLSRSSYSPGRVFAVHKNGDQLTMFVY